MPLNRYNEKIKTVDQLCKIIGKPPRKKKVIMCHGTFDIVHPGHIRQLAYGKEKADLLIASVTADKYVAKGKGKPFVPEELRVKNLAALELVDFAIIDYHPKPIKNILKIKPDIFIKGFEYMKDGIHPKTKEEIKAVSSYGGEVIFSPGDIIYSSTHLLTVHRPKISLDKLLAYMDVENVTFDDILNLLKKFKNTNVHVIGDTIVDKYSYCSVLGPTTKTPTFSIKLDTSELFVGGAGIVAKHLKNLGANVTFTTILGNDEIKDFVVKDLKKWKIKTNAIIDKTRPTTLKERFWADGYKLLQVDKVDNTISSDKTLNEVCNYIKKDKPDIYVFSDFRHGIFNKERIKKIYNATDPKSIKVADSQVSNRWGNILDFNGVDIIFPNEKEARFALGDQDTGLRPLAAELYRKSKAKFLVLKLGEKGILVYRKPRASTKPRDFIFIDSFVEELKDALGAGDALLSATSLGYKGSKDIFISAILGNAAAAVTCEKEGNHPVSTKDIEQKIINITNRKFE